MANVIDLKETLEITDVTSYAIERSVGSIGETLRFTIPRIDEARSYAPGTWITFKGSSWLITSTDLPVSANGYATTVNCVSKIGDLAKRSPPKTLMYMNMTAAEIDEFNLSTEDASLDYIPLLAKLNTNGTPRAESWDSHKIVRDLIRRAFPEGDVTVMINTYNYYPKQIQASSGSTFIETLLSLVSFLRPIVYSDDDQGILFILDRPLSKAPDVTIGSMESVSERCSFNFESRAKGFYFEGGQGLWRRNKSKIHAEAERETEIKTETYSETPLLNIINLTGEVQTIKKIAGTGGYGSGTTGSEQVTTAAGSMTVSQWLKEPMRDRQTAAEVWRLDPFGNPKALMSRHTVSKCLLPGVAQELTTFDALETYTYDFLTEEYDRPRLMTRSTVTGRYTWQVIQGAGLGSSRYFKSKVDEVEESWAYSPNGLLLQETKTISADVLCLASGIGNDREYVEVDFADSQWIPDGGDELNMERQVVEEEVTKYRQLNPDYYERSTTHRRLGALARKKGQENYSTRTEMLRGYVPRHPEHFRQMQVWWGDVTAPDSHDTYQDVPTVTQSNPNIFHWPDVEEIHNRMKLWASEVGMTERMISIPADIPIDIGWSFPLDQIPVAGGVSIPEAVAPNLQYVSAWSKSITAEPPSCVTTIKVEGR